MRWGTLCVLAVIATQASTASTWLRISSPTIEIFTDAGEKTARAVLRRFETLHRVFDDAHLAPSAAPARVFVFASRREYLEYEIDPATAGMYHAADGRDLIVAYEETDLRRVASHEFLHMAMRHSSAALPHWLDEGLADFYSTIAIDASKMHVGAVIPPHLSLLATQRWLNAEDLALGTPADGPIFYAESWALVHMLSLAPTWKSGMPEFVRLLNEGQSQDDAFPNAFGQPMDNALRELRRYLRSPREITLPAPPVEDVETYPATRLAPVDADFALADLALATRRTDLARSLILKAVKTNPQSPAAAAGLGSLALAEDRKDDARRQFERAIAMGYRNASTYFELAMLNNDHALLENVLSVDPNFANAHFLLGVRATDARNFAPAIEHLQQALSIEPRRFDYWHALGYAQAKAGDRRSAAESARRLAILASTPEQEKMAAALTLLASESPVVHEKKPDVITPASWQNRKGNRSAEGTLTWVNCDSSPVRLSLTAEAPAAAIELKVKNPNQVELLNAEGASTTLDCGEQARPVLVEYDAETMEVTRIEFRHVIIKR
jgi:tetratricopeptide (TPR) repeat protein